MIGPRLYWVREGHWRLGWPPAEQACEEPNGLLAAGGDLEATTLIDAYRRGVFPWFSEGDPILWWTPQPRAVLWPQNFEPARSLRRRLARGDYRVGFDTAFAAVVNACAAPREGAVGTWITPAMAAAYAALHRLGYAHSVEAWQDGDLVGGLYGVALGKVFFGESMFSRRTDASKVAFAHLVRYLREHDYQLIDCQLASDHLTSLGAVDMPRVEFLRLLEQYAQAPDARGPWHVDDDL
ncbi:leucyl/phenylalanyl-tRNA--protein transferase [Immundisolibacter sp.]|uniref:leucyl/phenylalanyl-tRNA--protein transferase n=1 Tax=Immundisolibacter sp. TaxID=1934948 RepID=UPI0035696236